jgi:peptidoglycan/LPS O-acetylase OafA/YrhL
MKASFFEFRIGAIDRLLLNSAVVYVGSISYGIYLFHVPLGMWLTEYVFDPVWLAIPWDNLGEFSRLRWHSWIFKFPLYTAATIALAALSYRFIESPILTFKDRWFRYGSGKSKQAAT